jgi:arylsulfatase A-like enzyme
MQGLRSPATALRRRRRQVAVLVSIVVSLGVHASRAQDAAADPSTVPACKRCNIVLITVDTLRPDHTSVYGYRRDTTPRLSDFFESGTRFDNAVSSAPCTAPSVAQLLRGGFDPGLPSVAERARAAGYETAAIASQHQFHRNQEKYRAGFEHWDLQPEESVDHHGMTSRSAAGVTEGALAWLEDAATKASPFLLWLHYFDPHDPYQPPAPFRHFDAGSARYADGDRRKAQQAAAKGMNRAYYMVDEIFDAKDRSHFISLYDGEIEYVDQQIGRVLDALAERGLTERSLVVFTADHGERLGRDGIWDHCYSLSEQELRVPFLVRIPGHAGFDEATRAGRTSTLDLVPTIASAVGLPSGQSDDRLVGRDLRRTAAPDPAAVAAWHGRFIVSRGTWKLYGMLRGGELVPRRLIRTTTTLDEVDAGDLDRHGPLVRDLLGSLDSLPGFRAHAMRISEQSREQLRALGYTE